MCGFLFIFDKNFVCKNKAIGALELLRQRGPDAFQWENYSISENSIGKTAEAGQIFMGHTRLSILETSQANNQPCETTTGSLIFNGEIYNYKELKKDPKFNDVEFRFQNSDTEVLAAGLSLQGGEFLTKLNGMFAGVFLDFLRKEIVFFRDYFGQKPIFYCHNGGKLIVSSEVKAILHYAPDTIMPSALLRGLISGFNTPNSVYKNIKMVRPGQKLSFRLTTQDIETNDYVPKDLEPGVCIDNEYVQPFFENALDKSLERHTRSDVPLGLYLSGGVDSSLLAKKLSEKSVDITCFSISFDDPAFDEAPYAKKVSEKFGYDLISETVSTPPLTEVNRILDYFDEPFYDASAIPTYYLNRLAAQNNIRVAIGGDGADEIFLGYKRYVYTYILHKIKSSIWGSILIRSAAIARDLKVPIRHKYLQNLDCNYKEYLYRNSSDLGMRKYFKSKLHFEQFFQAELARYSSDFPKDHSIFVYLQGDRYNYLSSDILTKSDRTGMMNGIEVRAPFLDLEMVRFAQTLKPNALIQGRQGKFLLKQALSKSMGSQFTFRRKQGFTFPLKKIISQNYQQMREQILENTSQIGLQICLPRSDRNLEMNREMLGHFWKLYVLSRFVSRNEIDEGG